jgi:outer membrane protein OmpA-like peptidoglycan-associated protein
MDSQGVVAAIKKISLDRARAVFDYFVIKGIEPGRLRIYGLSDNFPIANNNTAEGRRMNRRIMVIRE